MTCTALGLKLSANVRTKEARRSVDGGPEEHKVAGAFAAEGSVLVGGLHVEGNRVRHAKPAWMLLEVVH